VSIRALMLLCALACVAPGSSLAAQVCGDVSRGREVQLKVERATYEYAEETLVGATFGRHIVVEVAGGQRRDPGFAAEAIVFGGSVGGRVQLPFVSGFTLCPHVAFQGIAGPKNVQFSGLDASYQDYRAGVGAHYARALGSRWRGAAFASYGTSLLLVGLSGTPAMPWLPVERRTTGYEELEYGAALSYADRITLRASFVTLDGITESDGYFVPFGREQAERGVRLGVSYALRR
jgi:hypothetical protein